ncbi:MAG: porin [Alloacidobacterium sp.]
MRGFLLTGSAVALLSMTTINVDTALAQTGSQNPPPNVMEGVAATPLPIQSANNSNNRSVLPQSNGIANPTPGSIVVHLNGRVLFAGVVESSTLDVFKATPNLPPAKLDAFGTVGFMRIFSGVDAMATNGLRYGASIELRQDFGPAAGSTANSGGSANSFSSTVFVRRAFTYLATDKVGIIRLGQGDGPIGLFDLGVTTFQTFDTGGWDSDLTGTVPGNAQLSFPFSSLQGAEYIPSKLVYISPQLAGFDFAFAYAPNNDALNQGPNINSLTSTAPTLTTCAVAASGCPTLAASNVALDGTRFRNYTETGVRYQGNVGPVGLYGFGIYVNSGHVNVNPPVAGSQFNGLNYGDFGLAATYGGWTIGGHATVGQYNGVNGLQPRGGVPANAWLAGVQYTAGPWVAGASYYVYDSQGSPLTVGIAQRREVGLAVGTTYTLAPGLDLIASYLYGTRHQGDFNFGTSTLGAANNDTKVQLISLATYIKW